jgi:hypothetical protein
MAASPSSIDRSISAIAFFVIRTVLEPKLLQHRAESKERHIVEIVPCSRPCMRMQSVATKRNETPPIAVLFLAQCRLHT